jgi:putative phosphoesterase
LKDARIYPLPITSYQLRITTIGVVADTHVGDRLKSLSPGVLEALAGVDVILHAGDIIRRRVLDQLAEVAPVLAVAGNRDFGLGLPLDRVLEFDGVRLGLTHGHGGWLGYLRAKLRYVTVGYYLSHYVREVRARFAGQPVQAIVFGHSHRPVNLLIDSVLLFNPGSAGPDYYAPYHGPSVGRLTITGGTVRGEILPIGT